MSINIVHRDRTSIALIWTELDIKLQPLNSIRTLLDETSE